MILCHMVGQGLAGRLLCSTRQGQRSLSGIPLVDVSVWRAQGGFIPESGDLKWMLEAWAQLGLLSKAPSGWLGFLWSSLGLLRQHALRGFLGPKPRSPRVSLSPHSVGQAVLAGQLQFRKMKVRVCLFTEGISKSIRPSLIYHQRLLFLFSWLPFYRHLYIILGVSCSIFASGLRVLYNEQYRVIRKLSPFTY